MNLVLNIVSIDIVIYTLLVLMLVQLQILVY
jgi:hypothetical protein